MPQLRWRLRSLSFALESGAYEQSLIQEVLPRLCCTYYTLCLGEHVIRLADVAMTANRFQENTLTHISTFWWGIVVTTDEVPTMLGGEWRRGWVIASLSKVHPKVSLTAVIVLGGGHLALRQFSYKKGLVGGEVQRRTKPCCFYTHFKLEDWTSEDMLRHHGNSRAPPPRSRFHTRYCWSLARCTT